MTVSRTWLLVADAARARIFAVDLEAHALNRIPKHELDAETAPSRELGSDRPGRTFDSAGQGRHAKEPPTDPHRYEKRRFAHRLAVLLTAELRQGAFDRLLVVAPPQMLGDLRADYSDDVRAALVEEIAKDLTALAPHELEARLPELAGRSS